MGERSERISNSALAAERRAGPWIQRLARAGYAAKGVVYCLVGVLAFRAAFTTATAANSRGALRALLEQPFGRIVLAFVAVGLVGYSVWSFYQAARNPEDDAAATRIGRAGKGIIHIALALTAARLALLQSDAVSPGDSAGESTRAATAEALQRPLGMWIVLAVGIAIILHALWQFYRAATARLDDQLNLSSLSSARRTWVTRIARTGMAARGVVFVVSGGFLVRAALDYDPSLARDLGGSLRTIEAQTYGPWLLAFVGTGLFAYGIYEAIRARYRVIQPRHSLPASSIRLKRVS